MIEKKLKAGVIGFGVGREHAKAYRDSPFCDLVSICDFSDEKMRSIKDELFVGLNQILLISRI